jgi:hypothetical protein
VDTGVFQDRYLVAIEDAPARKVEPVEQLNITQEDVVRALDKLRYQEDITDRDKQTALNTLTNLVGLFLVDLPTMDEPVQIDIVTDIRKAS